MTVWGLELAVLSRIHKSPGEKQKKHKKNIVRFILHAANGSAVLLKLHSASIIFWASVVVFSPKKMFHWKNGQNGPCKCNV